MAPQDKKPTNWRAWTTGILIALVVVVCLQNSGARSCAPSHNPGGGGFG